MKSIIDKIEVFIQSGEGDFNQLACELFRFQCHANAAYGHYAATVCDRWDSIDNWEEIPALPIYAFKKSAVATFPTAEAAAVFRSSGTTSAERSAHYLKSTGLYDLSIVKGWPSRPAGRIRVLALSQPPAEAPDSSLVHMFRTLIHQFGDSSSGFCADPAAMTHHLGKALEENHPVWFLGTALALHQFLNYCEAEKKFFNFESNLLAMETGGFKGQQEAIAMPVFFQRLCGVLGISPFSVLSEYGMCELSSQFYTKPGAKTRAFHGSRWARWRVVHPMTGEPLPAGEKGALEIFDLANVGSAVAIRTEDVAHAGDGGFQLDGRIPNAPAKGCSLTVPA